MTRLSGGVLLPARFGIQLLPRCDLGLQGEKTRGGAQGGHQITAYRAQSRLGGWGRDFVAQLRLAVDAGINRYCSMRWRRQVRVRSDNTIAVAIAAMHAAPVTCTSTRPIGSLEKYCAKPIAAWNASAAISQRVA
jgi:hypothetical protein